MTKQAKNEVLEQARKPRSARLELKQADTVRLLVCGGAAGIATGLRQPENKGADVARGERDCGEAWCKMTDHLKELGI